MKTTNENITSLEPNQIFVFGSNTRGVHGKGAAKLASDKFGAIFGQGEGLQGQSYGIPTRGYPNGRLETLSVNEIEAYVETFIDFAKQKPNYEFLVTKIGCGLAGHSLEDMAILFKDAIDIPNVVLPSEFIEIIKKDK